MEKPSIMNIFSKEYSNSTMKHILIDINSIIKGDKWLPGAEEMMGALSSRPDDTEITVWIGEIENTDFYTKIFRKSRVFCFMTVDPIEFMKYDVIISPKTGMEYVDFPWITEFINKL